MHELSVAQRVVEQVRKEAESHGADRVDGYTLEVGKATHLNPEQLRFCIERVAEGTLAADAELTIRVLETRAECDCGWAGEPPDIEHLPVYAPELDCPECGDRVTVTQGRECQLRSIVVPDEPTS
jgi:hydrogenase nickel incorporation protein HypA/HybF